ncbi:MAG: DUF4250 domain-containing protein [Oscillospiraceae bacterium]|nr:DUF4250 domain-containing protein [Oscillospiraceae bacterium]
MPVRAAILPPVRPWSLPRATPPSSRPARRSRRRSTSNFLRSGQEQLQSAAPFHYSGNNKVTSVKRRGVNNVAARLPSDPVMLMSVLNTKLRDAYDSLDALCDDLQLDRAELTGRLHEAGFDYDPARNQFR